jgi:hypothetical protein
MTTPDGRAVLLWTTEGLEIATVSGVSRAIDGTYAVLDDTGRRVAALNRGENSVRVYDFGVASSTDWSAPGLATSAERLGVIMQRSSNARRRFTRATSFV